MGTDLHGIIWRYSAGITIKAISNPPRLSQHCSGVVEVLHQGLWRPVTFDLGSAEWAKVAEDICANLSCGAVYELRQNGTATLNYSSSTCLSQCVYRDLLVENCTVLSHTDCSNQTEITCGHQAVRLAGGTHHYEVNCGGSERNLWECPSLGTANDCGHKEDAAVVCSGIPSQSGNETAEQNTQTSTEAGSVLLVTSAESWSSPPTATVWGCIALSIALLLTLLSNVLLFLSYRRRAALLVHQRQDGHLLSIQSQHTDQGERVNLLTVTTDTADYTPQYLSQRPSQNDTNTSCDSDYENFSDQPSVAMATALVRVLDNGVGTSREPWETTQTAETSDTPEKYNIVAETINGIGRNNPAIQSLRSLLSSSTSSGECYENIETLEKELLASGPDLREAALTDLICRREPSLGSSSSTSSGESFENVGMAVEQHLQSDPFKSILREQQQHLMNLAVSKHGI
ncbi:hypothetical protein J4Q44_G00388270 [Coregonus suidteri]|uniref:SRCR domain-containing protein n=1 Tax=Coregonus suidteri TaxID=861788 RepID=A0AAN8KJP7_9TELE